MRCRALGHQECPAGYRCPVGCGDSPGPGLWIGGRNTKPGTGPSNQSSATETSFSPSQQLPRLQGAGSRPLFYVFMQNVHPCLATLPISCGLCLQVFLFSVQPAAPLF